MRTGLFAIVVLFSLLGAPLAAAQDVSVGINIGEPPPLSFVAPPDVVVVPSGESYVYMVPNRIGLYFYGGVWYRYHRGNWFQADIYNGPWSYVGLGLVPEVVVGIPPEYPRFLPPGYHRVHYGELHSHWRDWDRGRQWHRQEWYRREMRPEVRRERFAQVERQRGTGGAGPGTRGTLGAGPGTRGTPGAGPGTRGTLGAGPGTRGAPGAGPGTRGTPGAGPGTRSTPGATPGMRSTPGAAPATRSSPGAAPAMRSTPGAAPAMRSTPSAAPAMRSTPGAAPGTRSAPSAGAGSHATRPNAGAGSRNDKKDK